MTESPPEIRTATADERDAAIETLVLSFASDPFVRWMWPEPAVFLDAWKRVIPPFGCGAFDTDSAYVAPDIRGVALWLPPGQESDGEAMEAVVGDTIPEERLEEVGTVMAIMEEAHPTEEHWYLPVIGCDPAFTGKGLGGALMKHALARVDAEGMPAYLESSNPRNISLYQRHGFEIMGEIQHGNSPVMTPMWRAARG